MKSTPINVWCRNVIVIILMHSLVGINSFKKKVFVFKSVQSRSCCTTLGELIL